MVLSPESPDVRLCAVRSLTGARLPGSCCLPDGCPESHFQKNFLRPEKYSPPDGSHSAQTRFLPDAVYWTVPHFLQGGLRCAAVLSLSGGQFPVRSLLRDALRSAVYFLPGALLPAVYFLPGALLPGLRFLPDVLLAVHFLPGVPLPAVRFLPGVPLPGVRFLSDGFPVPVFVLSLPVYFLPGALRLVSECAYPGGSPESCCCFSNSADG